MTQEKDPVAELMRLADQYAFDFEKWGAATHQRTRADLEAHARTMAEHITKLETQLEAVGAGGVTALMPSSAWISAGERLPEFTESCDWLFPKSELKRERWILVGECMMTASVPGNATHWRPAQPMPVTTRAKGETQ